MHRVAVIFVKCLKQYLVHCKCYKYVCNIITYYIYSLEKWASIGHTAFSLFVLPGLYGNHLFMSIGDMKSAHNGTYNS